VIEPKASLTPPPTPSLGFRLEGVRVLFGATLALDQIHLSIEPGEAVAFVGPSGAGKTTLLRLLNATTAPTAGSVHVAGQRVADLSAAELRAARGSIGMVPQHLGLIPTVRVVQNVASGRLGQLGFFRSLRSMLLPSQAQKLEIHALLERVGIPEKLFERTDSLSGGQQQRVAIARALYQRPGALLADEPVSSVDPARAADTVGLLRDLSQEQGLTLCMSLHNLELARRFFPRIVGMRAGRIVFDRAADALEEAELASLFDIGNGASAT
jgi:phosphonate transport system ATP-binding protein